MYMLLTLTAYILLLKFSSRALTPYGYTYTYAYTYIFPLYIFYLGNNIMLRMTIIISTHDENISVKHILSSETAHYWPPQLATG
uniref:Uncharacterized protein n=1 Tax=Nelumbo nucifera TaxID=4432 RepID=A0A822ZP02_NELNU|nr:TPA_asm: hypothetical protein HUJ06_001748 [Nelumbo nucifera]